MKPLFVIGNESKTKFLAYDSESGRLITVDSYEDAEIMPQVRAKTMIESNKFTHFYRINDLRFLCPVKVIMLED